MLAAEKTCFEPFGEDTMLSSPFVKQFTPEEYALYEEKLMRRTCYNINGKVITV